MPDARRTEDRFHEVEMTQKLADIAGAAGYVVDGQTRIRKGVIAAIAATAAREVDGVADVGRKSVERSLGEQLGAREKRARGVRVVAGKEEVILDITIKVDYGSISVPQIVSGVRERVGARLLEMTGLVVKRVNVNVAKVEFPTRTSGRVN